MGHVVQQVSGGGEWWDGGNGVGWGGEEMCQYCFFVLFFIFLCVGPRKVNELSRVSDTHNPPPLVMFLPVRV